MAEHDQIWDLPTVRRVARRVDECADDLGEPWRLLARVDPTPQDGAGGVVTDALAEFIEVTCRVLQVQQDRLHAIARTVDDGAVTVREVDESNADGVLGALRRWLPGGATPSGERGPGGSGSQDPG